MTDDDMRQDEHGKLTGEDGAGAPGALRALDDVVAPDRLRLAVAEAAARALHARARRRRRLRLGSALAAAAALPALLLVVLGIAADGILDGGGAAAPPHVRDVAAVALRPVAAAAPAARPGGELLRAHAGPVVFPSGARLGWHAVGARRDTVRGHELRTVFYADAAGRRIGYTVADAELPVGGGRRVERRGLWLWVLDRGATSIVTWRRDGRTCILAGRGVPVARLLPLARYTA
jgi:hypothetical protein